MKKHDTAQRRSKLRDSSFAVALLAAALSSVSATTEQQQQTSITATYGPELYHTRSSLLHPSNIPYTKLSRINYSSFHITTLGKIYETNSNIDPVVLFGPYDWNPTSSNNNDVEYCHKNTPELVGNACAHHLYDGGLIALSHMNGVKVFGSVGNSSSNNRNERSEEMRREEAEVWGVVASTVGGRMEFASQCEWLITNYKFDGINIQWIYPQTEEEMTNYGLLLQTVRAKLDELQVKHGGATYGLTANMPCNSNDGIDYNDIVAKQVPNLDHILTEINLDTMNFHGARAKTAGFNTPLYTNTEEVDHASVNGCVLSYLEHGASREKLTIGLTFSGHSYRDAMEIGDECSSDWLGECRDTVTWNEDRGSPRYYNIHDLLPSMPLFWDEETLTPLAFHSNGIISYDDPKSICYKTEYTGMNRLNGVVIQEFGADMLLDKSTPLLDAVNYKILNENVDCDSAEFEQMFQWSSYKSTTEGINGKSEDLASSEVELNTVDVELDETKTTFRYTCGFGQGDAEERCSDPGWDDISCETGTCPEEGMLCYVVECVKPKNYALSGEKESYAAIWVKEGPKPIISRKPERTVKSETLASKVVAASNEAASEEAEVDLVTTDTRVWACGLDYYDAAGNCGVGCNSHSDCPKGFCFHVECGAIRPTTTTTSTPYSGKMVNKYQCGFERSEALMCQEDCNGFACDGGKYCFLVPCPES